jgi:hypothetical protein
MDGIVWNDLIHLHVYREILPVLELTGSTREHFPLVQH